MTPRKGAQPRFNAVENASKYVARGAGGGERSDEPVRAAGFSTPAAARTVGAMSTWRTSSALEPGETFPRNQTTSGMWSVASYAKRPCVSSP